jgi:hypothetical protein
MILENPALTLSIGAQDILEILEETLKERNWQKFDVANLKLTYVPYYIFNYDTLLEKTIEGDTMSQGFSGLMAMNAVTGKLEPSLTEIMEKQPVNYEREISHELQYEMQQPSILGDEIKQVAGIKLAAEFSVGKSALAISGIRLVYWPIWKVFVTLNSKKIQKIEVEAVNGMPMNIEEVPEREKTWMEVTSETIGKLKTPEGWAELSSVALKTTSQVVSAGTKKATENKGIIDYLKTKSGIYAIIGVLIIVLILLYM